MFTRYDDEGKPIRNRVAIDFSDEPILTEQSHKAEVDINNIIKRHGTDLIAKVAAMQSQNYTFDELPHNDFQEAMNIVVRAQGKFDALPSQVRKQFNNSPAEFLDFVQNPDNAQALYDMGLAIQPTPPEPVIVQVVQPPEAPAE